MNREVLVIPGYFNTMPARPDHLPREQCLLGWLGLPEAVGIGPSRLLMDGGKERTCF